MTPEREELTLRISSDLARQAIIAASPETEGGDKLRLEDANIALLACKFAAKRIEDMIEALNIR